MKKIKEYIKNVLSPVWLVENELQKLTKEALSKRVVDDSRWLDVGCGLRPFESSFSRAHYIGIDVENSGRSAELKAPDKFYDGATIPYEDFSFDGVLCTQVLEHVNDLDRLLFECNRVLKVGGILVITVPFVYKEHEQPHDYRRFTSYGLSAILEKSGFIVESMVKGLTAIETIAVLFCVYTSNNMAGKNRYLYTATGCLISLPLQLLAGLVARILPDDRSFYCILLSCSTKSRATKYC